MTHDNTTSTQAGTDSDQIHSENSSDECGDRYFVGLMAGTSLDGIDAACCRIRRTDTTPFGYDVVLESFVTISYPDSIREQLVTLCDDETGRVDDVCRLDRTIGVLLSKGAEAAIERAGLQPAAIEAIGSHGQTVWHIPALEDAPSIDRRLRSTLQIGDGATIAFETGIETISDFRTADIAAGGHGAPLAPFLDATLFSDSDESRALQNIGGIGNCTFLPPNPDREDVTAFDTGPGNMVIDAVVELISDGRRTYDKDGQQAAAGEPSSNLVSEFLDHPYFAETPPKTTGRELFGHDYARRFLAAGRDRGLSDDDIVASATLLTAQSIAEAYDRFADPYPAEAYVSGGGAYNRTLMSYLQAELDCSVAPLDRLGVEPDHKEAILFALLAATRLDAVPNTIPSATGANDPVVMGKVSRPW